MKIADSYIHTRHFNFVELNHRLINFDVGRAPIRLCRSQWRVHQGYDGWKIWPDPPPPPSHRTWNHGDTLVGHIGVSPVWVEGIKNENQEMPL